MKPGVLKPGVLLGGDRLFIIGFLRTECRSQVRCSDHLSFAWGYQPPSCSLRICLSINICPSISIIVLLLLILILRKESKSPRNPDLFTSINLHPMSTGTFGMLKLADKETNIHLRKCQVGGCPLDSKKHLQLASTTQAHQAMDGGWFHWDCQPPRYCCVF